MDQLCCTAGVVEDNNIYVSTNIHSGIYTTLKSESYGYK